MRQRLRKISFLSVMIFLGLLIFKIDASYPKSEVLRIDFHYALSKGQERFTPLLPYKQEMGEFSKNNKVGGLGTHHYQVFQDGKVTSEGTFNVQPFFSLRVPLPEKPIKLIIRKKKEVAVFWIEPDSIVSAESFINNKKFIIRENGPSSSQVDIVFLAEGYQEKELSLFRDDVYKFVQKLSLNSHLQVDKFNFYGVETESRDSGISIPLKGIFKTTALDAYYSKKGVESLQNQEMRDAASVVPYDYIVVIVNDKKRSMGTTKKGNYMFITSGANPLFFIRELIHLIAS